MWVYRVKAIVRVVDGDTLDARLDLGFRVETTQRLRLLRIDTPERGQEGWAEATAFTKAWLEEREGRLLVRTSKGDSFGRWLAEVYTDDDTVRTLSQALKDAGYAAYVP